jgi:ABC-type enterochelin transport system ATPase subunit
MRRMRVMQFAQRPIATFSGRDQAHVIFARSRDDRHVAVKNLGACIADGPPAQAMSTSMIAKAFHIHVLVTHVHDFHVIVSLSPLT